MVPSSALSVCEKHMDLARIFWFHRESFDALRRVVCSQVRTWCVFEMKSMQNLYQSKRIRYSVFSAFFFSRHE
jgi:hypothetical protein